VFKIEDKVQLEPGVTIICSKWCYITIAHTRYLVAWEFRKESPIALYQPAETENKTASSDGNASRDDRDHTLENETASSDGNASGDDRDHTLPFKVLGVAFKHRQRHLEAVFQKLENREEVKVDIKPQPDNDYDSNAIAVF